MRQPQIGIVARDRGGGYALAAQTALPGAIQVADRWHLMENASQAFLDAVSKSMRQVRVAIGATVVNPKLLTAAEKLQYEGFQRREETNAVILAMTKEGATIKQIVRRSGYSHGLVRKVLRGQRSDVFRIRSSSLDAHLPWPTSNGRLGAETARSFGAPSSDKGSGAAFVSSVSGADDDSDRKRWTPARSAALPRREPSRG